MCFVRIAVFQATTAMMPLAPVVHTATPASMSWKASEAVYVEQEGWNPRAGNGGFNLFFQFGKYGASGEVAIVAVAFGAHGSHFVIEPLFVFSVDREQGF